MFEDLCREYVRGARQVQSAPPQPHHVPAERLGEQQGSDDQHGVRRRCRGEAGRRERQGHADVGRHHLAPVARRQRPLHPRQQPRRDGVRVTDHAQPQHPRTVLARDQHAQDEDQERVGLAVEACAVRRRGARATRDAAVDEDDRRDPTRRPIDLVVPVDREQVEVEDDMTRRQRSSDRPRGLELGAVALAVVDGQRGDLEALLAGKRRADHRIEPAREQDDSVNYVMPNHMIFTLARAMPSTRAELFNVAQPATQTVRLRADELVATIAKAKKDGENGPEMLELLAKIDPAHFKKALDKAAQQTAAGFEGVAKYANQNKPAPVTSKIGSPLSIPLRSDKSMFWGGNSQQTRPVSTVPDVQLSVPMPPLTAEIFSETAASEAAQMETTPPSPEQAPAEEPQDDTFILKQLGRNKKRKLDEPAPAQDALATQTDEVTIDPSSDRAAQKAERKRLKREAKAAQEVPPAEEEEAFDYTTAPSILNPPRKTNLQLKAERKASKVKDPYKKSMDAPKGQARAQKERAGKSMTFKK